MIGIYKIENKINGKVYIGQSHDILYRWKTHIDELNSNRHCNSHLQKSWEKYGIENFSFSIIEECDYYDLDDKEIYWIEKYSSYDFDYGYNMTLGGKGIKKYVSGDKTNKVGCHAHKVEVICITTNKKFESLVDASNHYQIQANGITRCCKFKQKYCGIYNNQELVWMYLEDYKYMIDHGYSYMYMCSISRDVEPIICLNTLKKFTSLYDANLYANLSEFSRQIIECCQHNENSAGYLDDEKLIWEYYGNYKNMTEQEVNKRVELIKRQPVIKTQNKNRKIICLNTKDIFDTVKDAAIFCGLKKPSNISECCNGQRNVAGRHPKNREFLKWMYLDEYMQKDSTEIDMLLKKIYNSKAFKDDISVICLNTGQIFTSMSEASRFYNNKIPVSNISACCKGKTKSAGKDPITGKKLIWKYYKE